MLAKDSVMKLTPRKYAQLAYRLPQLYLESRMKLGELPLGDGAGEKSILIISSDPVEVVGSKGDEAMITALIEKIRAENNYRKVSIFCNLSDLPSSLKPYGIGLESPWSSPWSLKSVMSVVSKYDTIILIGADMLDGYYSLLGAARYWVVANLAARMGKTVVITGFSFNASPPRLLKTFMSPLSSAIQICLRDPVSSERFNRFVGIPDRAQLVADMAFSLEPRDQAEPVNSLSQWCQQKKNEGCMLVGLNIHPMLFKHVRAEDMESLVRSSVQAISTAVKLRPVAMVLIPHDYRPFPKGDIETLSRIYHALPACAQRRCHLVEEDLHAAELKSLAGRLDLVITGRMHLAIASLGMGTPIAGITYQDKFHGLFQHFGLSDEYLATPLQLFSEQFFTNWLLMVIDAQAKLKQRVNQHLDEVKSLSRRNFSLLVADS